MVGPRILSSTPSLPKDRAKIEISKMNFPAPIDAAVVAYKLQPQQEHCCCFRLTLLLLCCVHGTSHQWMADLLLNLSTLLTKYFSRRGYNRPLWWHDEELFGCRFKM